MHTKRRLGDRVAAGGAPARHAGRKAPVKAHYLTKPKAVSGEEAGTPAASLRPSGAALPSARFGWPLATLVIVGVSVLLWAGIAWFVGWLLE